MGTNYYFTRNVCPQCGRGDKPIHIGKSSMGWCFALHVDQSKGINSLEDWVRVFKEPNGLIRDEYDRPVSANDMLEIITNRSHPEPMTDEKVINGPFYYPSLAAFLRDNRAELGPNNLLRHKVDGYCIGHGDGPWDYMAANFS